MQKQSWYGDNESSSILIVIEFQCDGWFHFRAIDASSLL
jgi:hypothetical protein